MNVTNISVKLAPPSGDRLKAFCTMTLDDEFVVRDLKVIDGTSGLFVAMPSRKLTDHCPKCGGKNHLRAKFCNDCGARLGEDRTSDEDAQGKLHADVAHPINAECRNRIQGAILEAYKEECCKEGRPGATAEAAGEWGETPEPAPEAESDEARAAETPAPEPADEPPAPEPADEPPAPEPADEPPAPEPADEPPADASAPPTGEQPQAEQEEEEEEEPGQGHIFGEGIL